MTRRLMMAIAIAALAGCAKSGNGAGSAGGDSAGVSDTSRLGPPVGSAKATMDSGVAAGNARIDSLKQAGETPASGLAKGIQPAAHASNNDSSPGSHSLKVKPTNVP